MNPITGKEDIIDVADNSLSVIGNVALHAGEVALFALPAFQIPILGWILQAFVMYWLGKYEVFVIKILQSSANATLIFHDEEQKAKDATESSGNLAQVLQNPNSTPEEKQRASDDFDEKYSKLIGFRINSDSMG